MLTVAVPARETACAAEPGIQTWSLGPGTSPVLQLLGSLQDVPSPLPVHVIEQPGDVVVGGDDAVHRTAPPVLLTLSSPAELRLR